MDFQVEDKRYNNSLKVAKFGIFVSVLTLLGIVLLCPIIIFKSSKTFEEFEMMSKKFKEDSDILWNKMMKIGKPDTFVDESNPKIQFFSIKKRHAWDDGMCKGCGALACPMGLPGSPGDPGLDGTPGESGRPGQAGEDGFDIQIEVTEELPCVICPGGPPGLRGNQGERGMTGEPGRPGGIGDHGNHGPDGPPGNPGVAGEPGVKGPEGPTGEKGNPAFSGIGLKGSKGPTGPQGPKGPPGIPGKRSRDMGENGRPGPAGPPGASGAHGAYGEEGPWGPVGEPGMPATFCPSDCGVSHILAPNYNHAPVRGDTRGEQQQSYEPEDNTVSAAAADNRITPEEVEPNKQTTEYKKYRFHKRI